MGYSWYLSCSCLASASCIVTHFKTQDCLYTITRLGLAWLGIPAAAVVLGLLGVYTGTLTQEDEEL
jgi:hypothetical protein